MFKQLLIGAGLTLASSFAMAAPVLIDDFSTAQGAIKDTLGAGCIGGVAVAGGCASFASDGGAGNILGSERDLFADATGVSGTALTTDGTSIGVTGGAGNLGLISFSNDSGVFGVGAVTWDGADGSNAVATGGLGAVDLTGGGANNALRIETISADAGFDFTINLWWAGGASSASATFQSIGNPTGNPPLVRFISFATIDFVAGVAIDYTTISAIQVLINFPGTQADIDLRVDSLATVPEPGTLSMIALALIGLYMLSRRKKLQSNGPSLMI